MEWHTDYNFFIPSQTKFIFLLNSGEVLAISLILKNLLIRSEECFFNWSEHRVIRRQKLTAYPPLLEESIGNRFIVDCCIIRDQTCTSEDPVRRTKRT
ncbi:MAG: hypothetical protein MHMPM18_002280 [Marteilia pararefringens]